jgi:hypothetical protein
MPRLVVVGASVLSLIAFHATPALAQINVSNLFVAPQVQSANDGGFGSTFGTPGAVTYSTVVAFDATSASPIYGYLCAGSSSVMNACGSNGAGAMGLNQRQFAWNPEQYIGSTANNTAPVSGTYYTVYLSNTPGFPATNATTVTTTAVASAPAISWLTSAGNLSTNLTVDQSSGVLTPTFSWSAPAGLPAGLAAGQTIQDWVSVFDLTNPFSALGVGPGNNGVLTRQGNLIYNSTQFSGTSFTIPGTVVNSPAPGGAPFTGLIAGDRYLFDVSYAVTDGPEVPGCVNCNILARSQTYVDYTAAPVPEPATAGLAILGLGAAAFAAGRRRLSGDRTPRARRRT